MEAVARIGDRGAAVASTAILGALTVLAFTIFSGLPVQQVAPIVALTAVVAVAYRTLLAWQTLLALTILVVLAIPIRRYTMPGNLPFELEPYRVLVILVAAAWFVLGQAGIVPPLPIGR